GVDAGGTLTVSGQLMVEPGVSDGGLTKFGSGTLVLAGTADNVITGTTTVVQGTLVLNKDRSGAATPLPFNSGLVIGDNRDGVVSPEAPRVVLGARDQIPELSFFKTAVNTVTVNSTGTLDLAGFNDLSGTNTYLGVTRLTAGFVDVGSDAAFGASPLVALAGSSLLATDSVGNPAARTVANPLSLDNTTVVFGSGALTFTGKATLTASR